MYMCSCLREGEERMARTIGTRSALRKVQPAPAMHVQATVDRNSEAGTVDAGGDTGVTGVRPPARNPGVPLDLGWVNDVRVNASAVERRAATMVARRAVEIDVVISRAQVLRGEGQALYDEVRDFRAACGTAHLKTILATGELGPLRNVGRASLVCMMAGADFVKTSTGQESVNATLPVGLVMARAICAYYERTGRRVGFKPAGGIRSARQALDWLALIKEELGDPWLHPDLFRIGASGLLADIERQPAHTITGRYAAAQHHPMP